MKIFVAIIMVFSGFVGFAQNVEPQVQPSEKQPTVEELAAEIQTLKKKSDRWDRFVEQLPKVSGYVQTLFDWTDNQSTFTIKRVRLNLFNDIGSKLDYKIQAEFASSVKLVDVFLRYKPFDELNFQMGEFKIPLTIFNTNFKPASYEFIDTPMAISRLVGGSDLCGVKGASRDVGAQIYGGFIQREGFSMINYNLAVFNGEGINVKDKNSSKDVVGRLTLMFLKGLKLSGSFYWGETGKEYRTRQRYSGGMEYINSRLLLRGEWVGGRTGMICDEQTMEIHTMRSSSWYVSGGYYVTPKWLASARFDTFLEDTSMKNSRQTNYTVSLMWIPLKHFRCMVNYTYEDYDRTAPFFTAKNGSHNHLGIMLTGSF